MRKTLDFANPCRVSWPAEQMLTEYKSTMPPRARARAIHLMSGPYVFVSSSVWCRPASVSFSVLDDALQELSLTH